MGETWRYSVHNKNVQAAGLLFYFKFAQGRLQQRKSIRAPFKENIAKFLLNTYISLAKYVKASYRVQADVFCAKVWN